METPESPPPQTAIKTAPPSPRSGYRLPLGNHPGNTGGKKGRSGPKADKFREALRHILADPKVAKAVKEVLEDPRNSHFSSLWARVAAQAHGNPVQQISVNADELPALRIECE